MAYELGYRGNNGKHTVKWNIQKNIEWTCMELTKICVSFYNILES